MKRHVLLRLYPRAWRERYGEELSAQLEAQRPLRIGVVTDLVRGALDAHLHPLRRDDRTIRSSYVSDRGMIAARAIVAWSPLAAVAVAAAIVLIDFWGGHGYMIWWWYGPGSPVVGGITLEWYRLPANPPVAFPNEPQLTLAPYDGSSWVRFVPSDQLYDLALQVAVLALALAGALIFAAMARKAAQESEPSVS
jgi:hypothetical protein